MQALVEHFANYAIDYDTTPAVTITLTYIDPQPFTPMHDLDLREKIIDIDHTEVYRAVNGRNKRVRVMPLARPEKSLLRTLLARCESRADYNLVRGLQKRSHADIISAIPERMIGSASLNEVIGRKRRGDYAPSYWHSVDRLSSLTKG
jgi:hypothetical protein